MQHNSIKNKFNCKEFLLDSLKCRKKPLIMMFIISLFLQWLFFGFLLWGAFDHNSQEEFCIYTAGRTSVPSEKNNNYVITWLGFRNYNPSLHLEKDVYVEIDGRNILRSNFYSPGHDSFCALNDDAIYLIKASWLFSFAAALLLSLLVYIFIIFINLLRMDYDDRYTIKKYG